MTQSKYNEKPPHHALLPHVPAFLEARKKEAQLLEQKQMTQSEIQTLCFDWASFSEPYGFGFLQEFAEKMLTFLKDFDELPKDLIDELKSYLQFKESDVHALGTYLGSKV